MQVLRICGETGGNAANWFQRILRGTWQDCRSKIAFIRNFVAIVLFDPVFERLAFGFVKGRKDAESRGRKLSLLKGVTLLI